METSEEIPLETLLEATMFGAGRSMSVTELCESLGYDEEEMLDSLSSTSNTTSKEVWCVTTFRNWSNVGLRSETFDHTNASKGCKTDMPQKLLKAASLIAYHQPIAQSRLVDMLGPKAYDYVRELAQAGMIDRRKDGSTRRLTTTRRFAELLAALKLIKRR